MQRKCACGRHTIAGGECAGCRAKRLGLQRQAVTQTEPATAPPIVHEVLRSPGQPLDTETRTFMEPRFGHDFSQVRAHTDAKAAASAQAVNAQAYTFGHDIVFDAGQYAPETQTGRHLLAHELAHVVQQDGQDQSHATRPKVAQDGSGQARTAERTAERISKQVTDQPNTLSALSPGTYSLSLQRLADDSGGPSGSGYAYNRCVIGLGCPAVTHCEGRPCAVVDCGTGSCPFCPPGFENLVIRAWCVYSCVGSGSAFILITTPFNLHIGPICLD